MSTELKRVLDKLTHKRHELVDSVKKTGASGVELLAYEAGLDRAITIIRHEYRKTSTDLLTNPPISKEDKEAAKE